MQRVEKKGLGPEIDNASSISNLDSILVESGLVPKIVTTEDTQKIFLKHDWGKSSLRSESPTSFAGVAYAAKICKLLEISLALSFSPVLKNSQLSWKIIDFRHKL